jgi:DNA-binding MarR family transcriptional regulator
MKHLLLIPLYVLMLACASAAPVATSSADSISYMPVLLNQPEIHKDLKISPVQDARINVIRAECRAKVGVLSAEGLLDPLLAPVALKNLPRYQASCNRRVLAVLTPSQRVRFREIERQFHGGLFLLSPSEQNLLKLTPEQRHKIAEIRSVDATKAAEVQQAFREGKKTQLRREMDLHRIHRTTARSLLAVLTPEQKKVWLSSLGTPLKK